MSKKLRAELNRLSKLIEKQESIAERKAVKALNKLLKEITASIVTLDKVNKSSINKLVVQINKIIVSAYLTLDSEILDGLIDVANTVSMNSAKMINGVSTNLNIKVLPKDYLESLASENMINGLTQREWWSKQSRDFQLNFLSQMRQGLAAGESNADLIRRVRGTRENAFKDGIIQSSTRNARALVRTATQSVAQQTKLEIFEKNSDVIECLEFSSTHDSRVTDGCRLRDGKMYTFDLKPIGHSLTVSALPRHFNCRSQWLPVLRDLNNI